MPSLFSTIHTRPITDIAIISLSNALTILGGVYGKPRMLNTQKLLHVQTRSHTAASTCILLKEEIRIYNKKLGVHVCRKQAGCEAAVHAMRATCDDPDTEAILLVYVSNAFNHFTHHNGEVSGCRQSSSQYVYIQEKSPLVSGETRLSQN